MKEFLINFFKGRNKTPLPPWIQFPGSDPLWKGWRQGKSKSWLYDVWVPFWQHLSPEQRDLFLKRNPYPNNFKDEWEAYFVELWGLKKLEEKRERDQLLAVYRASKKIKVEKSKKSFIKDFLVHIFKGQRQELIINPESFIPLAPWIQFPYAIPTSSAWHQGESEVWFCEVWMPFWQSLSPQKRAEFILNNPYPDDGFKDQWKWYMEEIWSSA